MQNRGLLETTDPIENIEKGDASLCDFSNTSLPDNLNASSRKNGRGRVSHEIIPANVRGKSQFDIRPLRALLQLRTPDLMPFCPVFFN